MRVGTVCFATQRGLGYLAKSFYDHGIVTDAAVMHHGSIPTYPEWYPGCVEITTRPTLNEQVKEMVRSVDVMLFFETPFDWGIINFARQVGTKTVLMTMYECTPERLPYVPDFYLCPSLLDKDYFPDNSVFIPIPVDPELTPWNPHNHAEVYVHNGGYLGLQGREGTTNLIDAMEYVKSSLRLIVRCQKSVGAEHESKAAKDPRIEYFCGQTPYDSLYSVGDVAVGAQIWNGCSLPLQEAYASGLLVMNTNRYPMNSWLPTPPLIPVKRFDRGRAIGGGKIINIARVNPRTIAVKMDEWYGIDISVFSQIGKDWGEQNSWENLGPKYREVLQGLLP